MDDKNFKVPLEASLKKLQESNNEFIELFKHGSLSVEIYKPDKMDKQTPHTRDEIYVIASGSGEFVLSDKRTAFSPGDVLFVPAGKEHRFENFTDNFVTWVFFYGPEGGEDE
jgi:mannose-6-phosphate isomerase-like protein (cupin superfamily)